MIIGAVAMAAAFYLGLNVRVSWRHDPAVAQGTGLGIQPGAPQKSLGPDEIYARASQVIGKSVVYIDTVEQVRVRDWFFGDRVQDNQSSGSGVLITPDGYILTNEHVVGPANEAGKRITIFLPDGRKFPGSVVGADRQSDVALVKIQGKDLPAAQVGTVRGLVPGQIVIALGSPLDFRFTVTNGVISALGRPIEHEGRIYSDLIQHDALINPGNSGGALVNLQGQVIGINTLIRPDAQGIGFAIPIDTALRVADELKRFGKVKRPWLGLVTITNNDRLVSGYGVSDVRGAVVQAFYRGGPSVDAGIEPGDVITSVNGKTVTSKEDFEQAERSLKIRDRVVLEVHRGDKRIKVAVVVGEAP